MDKKFGERLAKTRKENNFTQDELAKLIHVHGRHISRIEQGKANPSAEVIKRIAEVLKVSIDQLLCDDTSNIVTVRINDKELLKSIEEVDRLTEEDRTVIKRLIQAFIKEKRMKEIAIT